MADREGFEPSVGFPTHTFQACGLNQLTHLSIFEKFEEMKLYYNNLNIL